MRITIAGGHGQIAQHLERQLTAAGHEAVGLVRNPDHVADLEANGAEAVVLDLEDASVADVARGARRLATPSCSPPGADRTPVSSARKPSTRTPPSCWPTRRSRQAWRAT